MSIEKQLAILLERIAPMKPNLTLLTGLLLAPLGATPRLPFNCARTNR